MDVQYCFYCTGKKYSIMKNLLYCNFVLYYRLLFSTGSNEVARVRHPMTCYLAMTNVCLTLIAPMIRFSGGIAEQHIIGLGLRYGDNLRG